MPPSWTKVTVRSGFQAAPQPRSRATSSGSPRGPAQILTKPPSHSARTPLGRAGDKSPFSHATGSWIAALGKVGEH